MRRFLAGWALVIASACASSQPLTGYLIGAPESGWQRLEVEGGDVAYKHRDGGTIYANRMCKDVEDVSLDVLTNHLFFDMEIDREVQREEITLAGRGALRTHVLAELDGVPVELVVVVMKKDGCTYDMALVADRNTFEAREPDFNRFLETFQETSAG
jgi:hypothetical protein